MAKNPKIENLALSRMYQILVLSQFLAQTHHLEVSFFHLTNFQVKVGVRVGWLRQ